MMIFDHQHQQVSLGKLTGYVIGNDYVFLGFLSFGAGAVLCLTVLAKEEVNLLILFPVWASSSS